jgi:hypothetical protein
MQTPQGGFGTGLEEGFANRLRVREEYALSQDVGRRAQWEGETMSQLAWDILLTLFFLFLGGVFLLFVVISGALTVVT